MLVLRLSHLYVFRLSHLLLHLLVARLLHLLVHLLVSHQAAHRSAGAAALGETDDSVLLLDALIVDFPAVVAPQAPPGPAQGEGPWQGQGHEEGGHGHDMDVDAGLGAEDVGDPCHWLLPAE